MYCVTVAFTMTERADQLHHHNAPAHSTALVEAFFFWQSITSPRSVSLPYSPDLAPPRLLAFPKAKIAVERKEICACDGHTAHKLSKRRLTADWLDAQESECSRMHSKVFSDWLPSYINATRPVPELFRMAGYFPDSLRIVHVIWPLSTVYQR